MKDPFLIRNPVHEATTEKHVGEHFDVHCLGAFEFTVLCHYERVSEQSPVPTEMLSHSSGCLSDAVLVNDASNIETTWLLSP